MDDPIGLEEIVSQVEQLKSNKAAGLDGISPSLVKCLPNSAIMLMCLIFNYVFSNGLYPESWYISKLITIHKRSNKLLCSNYRGISILNIFAKIYDAVLTKRLNLWWAPDDEQTGAQSGKGCTEQIVTLRLLISIAKKLRKPLYIIFIDFNAAYDRVPRYRLIEELVKLGCGKRMTSAIRAMYEVSYACLNTLRVNVNIGVKQGAPSSPFLFTLFINPLIRQLKELENDSFLNNLHGLFMMDDSVFFASSRENCLSKLRILQEFCNSYGMIINQVKTKFMVINGTPECRTPLRLGDLTVNYCSTYNYLGAFVTDDGLISSVLLEHYNDKLKHKFKYEAFINRNMSCPFWIKKLVLNSAFTSSVLYSCESWGRTSGAKIKTLYMDCIKACLGVRRSTHNELCLLEIDLPSITAYIKRQQQKFFTKVFRLEEKFSPLLSVLGKLEILDVSLLIMRLNWHLYVKTRYWLTFHKGRMHYTIITAVKLQFTSARTLIWTLVQYIVRKCVIMKDTGFSGLE